MQRQSYRLTAGSLANLKLETEELPAPGPGEATVEVKAIGLNFADIFAIWGLYGATPKGSFVPGLEYAGIVIRVGEGVTRLKVGDQVMGVTRFGAYTTHLNIDTRYLIPLPQGWSFAEGASYLVQVLTAHYGLKELGNIREGQTVLIHSAAGGVGLWANRIAKQYQAYTIGTVGNPAKLELLKQEGYDQGIVRGKNFKDAVLNALGGRELNIIMECIGGKILKQGYELLAPQGRMVVYGAARYGSVGNRPNYLRLLFLFLTRPKIDPQKMPENNKAIMGFNLIWLYHRAELLHELLAELSAMDLGRPLVGHTFPFNQLKDAILLFQSGKTMGKVVVEVAVSSISVISQ
ncbi:MAG: zinc-binding dehydrogenase [Phaeodactylibacter sp.]|nr:zinc-binding dehydrogenase [Phaeodactylibacter sp.]MCB9299501.1 zinc-binding dehydrogenase [Lewinellaceae bacterium]